VRTSVAPTLLPFFVLLKDRAQSAVFTPGPLATLTQEGARFYIFVYLITLHNMAVEAKIRSVQLETWLLITFHDYAT
jgi:hypothetical protein